MKDARDSLTRIKAGGIVLCGGRSRRMGRAKEWLTFGPEVLLQRVVRLASQAVAPVVVAARPGQHLPALPAPVRVVYDAVPDCGPLAGLAAAFSVLAPQCEAVFVTTCDHPLLQPTVVARLIEQLNGHLAVVPTHGGRAYPLTAVYRLTTRSLLAEALAGRDRSACSFAERCQAAYVSSQVFRDLDPELTMFENLNDRRAYQSAVRACGY